MQIDQRKEIIETRFKELKAVEQASHKRQIINQIRIIAKDIFSMMQTKIYTKRAITRLRITDILNKCIQIEKSINTNIVNVKEQYSQSHTYSQNLIKRLTVELIVQRQMRPSQLRINYQQVKEVADKIQNNLDLMINIDQIIEINKSDINQIQSFIDQAQNNITEANSQLDEAAIIRHQTVMLKVRTAFYSFLGFLGYITLGVPGMIGSLFMGLRIF